jgi:hypothetical protein
LEGPAVGSSAAVDKQAKSFRGLGEKPIVMMLKEFSWWGLSSVTIKKNNCTG